MKRFNIISKTVLLGLFGISMISCTDFLTLYPQDRVVEENFWEDKNDLEGVRYGAYKQMISTLSNFVAWGDIRSDAYLYNPDNPNSSNYEEAMMANPDSTMTFYDWAGVYTTINFCNKVLSHGDLVLERDPQFTPTEWEQMRAEMVALRALNYFYLIRSFKDIPFTFDVISSDEDVRIFGPTLQMDVLNTLIADVRQVVGQGKSRFPSMNDTKGLMTNTAIYALLADMYLWRSALREGRGFATTDVNSDADSVVFFGQKSLDALAKQNEQITASTNENTGRRLNKKVDFGSGLSNALLIRNEDLLIDYNSNSSSIEVESYANIFQTQNSEESIFELQYSRTDDRSNGFVKSFWGYNADKTFTLAASQQAVNNALGDLMNKDCRVWYSCQDEQYMYTTSRETNSNNKGGLFLVTKWLDSDFDRSNGTLYTDIRSGVEETNYCNWIIYRMTDVMLMMAEAHAVLGNLDKCKAIVDAIQKRSMLDQESASGLSKTSDNTKEKCIDLVMKERLIEFMGEGKRWFDLVRWAERVGGGSNPDPREPQYTDGAQGVKDMVNNYLAKGSYAQYKSNLVSRMKNRYGLYSPIYYREISANKYQFPQNPSWNREKGLPQ